jgi:hypothetical protein
MPNPDRPKVGPADPETRRKMLREKLDEPTRSEGVAPAPAPAPKPKKKKGVLRDLLDPTKEREPTHDGKTLDEVVSAAVDNAPKRPTR